MERGPKRTQTQTLIERLIESFENSCFDSSLFFEVIKTFAPEHEPLPPNPPILGAVYKGGGVRVTAYTGANCVLEQMGAYDDVDYLIGASGGGLIGLLGALGISPSQVVIFLHHLKFLDFADKRESSLGNYFATTRFGKLWSALYEGHVYTGAQIRRWGEVLIEHALGNKNATFHDLHEAKKTNPALKDLYLVVTRLTPQSGESRELVLGPDTHPHVKLIDAFCATTAYTPVYPPVYIIDTQGHEIGYCHDGGFINNFPIDKADSPEFTSPSYPLVPVRVKDYARKDLYNPCVAAFMLMTDVNELDPDITPICDKLQELRTKVMPSSLKPNRSSSWSHTDLARSSFRYAFGKFLVENHNKKSSTHPRTTIQIYDEGVETLDFNMSIENRQIIMQSGVKATRLWYQKFHNPSIPYQGPFEPKALFTQLRALKKTDPKQYKVEKLKVFINAFMKALMKPEALEQTNYALLYYAYQIKHLIGLEREVPELKEAWAQAANAYGLQKIKREAHVHHMEVLVEPLRLQAFLAELFLKNTKEADETFQLYLKGNVSVLFKVAFTGPEPLANLAAEKRTDMLKFILELVHHLCLQRNQVSFDENHDPKALINQMAPSLLRYANKSHHAQSVPLCLAFGCNPFQSDEKGKTPIHHAMDDGLFEAFIEYLDPMQKNCVYPKDIHYGPDKTPLWHYLLLNGGAAFLKKLLVPQYEAKLAFLVLNSQPDAACVTVFEQLTCLNEVGIWREVLDRFQPGCKDLYTQHKKNVQTKRTLYEQKAEEVFTDVPLLPDNAMLISFDPDMVPTHEGDMTEIEKKVQNLRLKH